VWRLCVCVLTACGRIAFDPLEGGDAVGEGGAVVSACPSSSWGTWGTPVNLGLVNSTDNELTPTPSADELLLVFDSNRPGVGGRDIYVSERADRASPWQAPVLVAGLSSLASDQNPRLVMGDTVLLFASNVGASNSLDLFTATRTGTTFGPRIALPGYGADVIDEYGADFSQDGLELVLAVDAGGGNGDLHLATRGSTAAVFGSSAPIGAANSANIERGASLSPDGLELYFESDRAMGDRIFRATRTSTTTTFGIPSEVIELRLGLLNRSPKLSADGATMYFASNGPGTVGGVDMWITTRPCLAP
jgi:Tol biopolymer transport system component